uniref:uncharacterized protein isoform X5 n=1 Tax=Pristiophorus japonicus TaxID=55135 RepID=UPI00398F8AFC
MSRPNFPLFRNVTQLHGYASTNDPETQGSCVTRPDFVDQAIRLEHSRLISGLQVMTLRGTSLFIPVCSELEDSNHPSAQCAEDQPIASTSVVTHMLCDFTPHRDDEDEEEEEQHIFLQPVEVKIDLVPEQDRPTAPVGAETLSSTESVFLGFPNCSEDSAGTSHVYQQGTPSVTAPLSQRRRLLQQTSGGAARQTRAYQDMVCLSQHGLRSRAAHGHGYHSRKQCGAQPTTVRGHITSHHCDGAKHQLCRWH